MLSEIQDRGGRLRMGMLFAGLALALVPAVRAWAVPCDLNGDGRVDAADVQLVINAALGRSTGVDCDVNGSGEVDSVDLQLIINGALGRPVGVEVPEVVGLAYEDAGEAIAQAGLCVWSVAQVYSAEAVYGQVLGVTPGAGTVAWQGTGLELVVSNGTLPATSYAFEWASPDIYQPWQFQAPTAVAVAPDGSVYVADVAERFKGPTRILKFTASGVLEAQWGSEGSGPGQFEEIGAIAVGPDGSVYVASGYQSWGPARIQKFTPFGTFITQWSGTSPYGLTIPVTGLDVGPDGLVYACMLAGKIVKFTPSGQGLAWWWEQHDATDRYYLTDTRHKVTLGLNGSVYILDIMNWHIQQFTSSGEYVTQSGWEWWAPSERQIESPTDMAAGPDGSLYVLSGNEEPAYNTYVPRVQKFTPSGGLVTQWGTEGKRDGQFLHPGGIGIGQDGSVYVADTWNKRIQQFTASGDFVTKWGSVGANEGEFASPFGVGIGLDGTYYVAEKDNHRVQHFTAEGEYLGQWGVQGNGNGEFQEPHDVAVGPDGSVFVVDSEVRIQQFTASGAFVAQWKPAVSHLERRVRCSVAVGPDGSVYLAYTGESIKRYTAPGVLATEWGTFGHGPGQFYRASGIAVGSDGSVYVADTGNDRIQRFTATGEYVTQWGSEGAGDGQFKEAWGLAVGPDGTVFVADEDNHRIQRFTASGVLLERWGLKGNGEGLFLYPLDVAVGADGAVYVADTDNNRIQKFVPPR